MARAPLDGYRVTPHGAYAYRRRAPGEGACGVSGFPCTHPGVDLAPLEPDAWVVAPTSCVVRFVAVNNITKPLSGYGPGALLVEESGRWWWPWSPLAFVVAHLDPASWRGGVPRRGRVYAEGEPIARVASSVGHVHWEGRTVLLPPAGQRMAHTFDPLAWVRRRRALGELAACAAATTVGALVARSSG